MLSMGYAIDRCQGRWRGAVPGCQGRLDLDPELPRRAGTRRHIEDGDPLPDRDQEAEVIDPGEGEWLRQVILQTIREVSWPPPFTLGYGGYWKEPKASPKGGVPLPPAPPVIRS